MKVLRHRQQLKRFIIALCAFMAFFEIYDHVPSRPWIYRQFATKYFVDVTADLEVDGAPLQLKRTIRCIKQPRPVLSTADTSKDSSVFDVLGGVSMSGRSIVINVPQACSFLSYNNDRFANESIIYNSRLQQIYGYPKRVQVPRVLELVGDTNFPDAIFQYYPGSLDGAVYNLQLKALKITHSDRYFKLFDGEAYDDFSWSGAWYVKNYGTSYLGRFLIHVPTEVWQKSSQLSKRISDCKIKPCIIDMLALEFDPVQHAIDPLNNIGATFDLYPTIYRDGVFKPVWSQPNRVLLERLPKEHEVFKERGRYYNYDFGQGAVSIDVTDRFYISSDNQVYIINAGIGVRLGL